MGFEDCINSKIGDQIDEDRGEVIKSRLNDIKENRGFVEDDDLMLRLDDIDEEAAEEIKDRLIQGLQKSSEMERYRALRQAQQKVEVIEDIENGISDEGRLFHSGQIDNMSEGAIATVSGDIGRKSDIQFASAKQKDLEGRFFSYASEIIREINERSGSEKQLKLLEEKLLKAHFDEVDVDGRFRELSDELENLFKVIRDRYHRAGGELEQITPYVPNPIHSQEKMAKVSKNEWIRRTFELLDREKMKSFKDGHVLIEEELLHSYKVGGDDSQGLLGHVYDQIVSGDRDVNKALGETSSKPLNERAGAQRILHFDGSDAWMKYNEMFGEGTLANAIEGYVHKMSRDVAVLDKFGPDPEHMRTFIKDYVEKRAREIGEKAEGMSPAEASKRARENLEEFDANFDYLMNTNMATSSRWSEEISSLKNISMSATIGSATLSALAGDAANSAYTAAYNGLPSMRFMTAGLREFAQGSVEKGLRQIGLFDGATRDEVMHDMGVQAGIVTRAVIGETIAMDRYVRRKKAYGWTDWLAQKSTKYSGLNLFTRTKDLGFKVEFGKLLAATADSTPYSKLDQIDLVDEDKFTRMLNRYNIGEREWKIMRQTPFKEESADGFAGESGTAFEWFRPKDMETDEMVARTGLSKEELSDIAGKFRRMTIVEADNAVPKVNNRSASMISHNFGEGAIGQLVSQYKAFPMTQYTANFSRAFIEAGRQGSYGDAAMSLGLYGAFMVPMGALAVQTRELAKGNDPADMQDPNFWAKAIATSGGLTLFGDVLLRGRTSEYHSMRDQISGIVGGPGLDFAEDTLDLVLGNALRFSTGGEAEPLKQGADWLKQWTPFSNMWYARAMLERGIFDKIQRLADPEAQKNFEQNTVRMLRDQNQGQWAPQGAGLTGIHGPELGQAWGGATDR